MGTFVDAGIPREHVPELIDEMGKRGDRYAEHYSCGFLTGHLRTLMCRRGHLYEPGSEDLSIAEVKRLWAMLVREGKLQAPEWRGPEWMGEPANYPAALGLVLDELGPDRA